MVAGRKGAVGLDLLNGSEYRIYNEDCLEGMKRLADNSVDLILTDLPFQMTDCAWDKKKIDMSAMWTEFKRILKPYSSAVLFASGRFAHELIVSNFDWYKYKWIWIKNSPTFFVQAKNAPMRIFEEILVFSDGAINHASVSNRRMKYNPQGVVSCEKIGSTMRTGDTERPWRQAFRDARVHLRSSGTATQLRGSKRKFGSAYGERPSHKEVYIQEQTGYPSDVLYYDVVPAIKKEHPTQKPVPLLEYLIRTYTDTGELVLDATMGSGSTGVACINTRRQFIGFELEPKFYEIAQKRIEDAISEREQSLFAGGDDFGGRGELRAGI